VRVNFASQILNDPNKVGVRDIIERIKASAGSGSMSSDDLVDACLDILGPLDVLDTTRSGLKNYASKYGELSWGNGDASVQFDDAAVAIIQLIVTTQEYQTA
jgi:hypothetical protein